MIRVILKPNKERPIRMGHPWVFSGAIARVDGQGVPGDTCQVASAGGEILGHGYYNPHSSITVRMLTHGTVSFDSGELCRRIETAAGFRSGILSENTTACRLVNSEGDFLPGLVVDRYGDGICFQILTAGMERYRDTIVSCLASLSGIRFVYERSDADMRQREGLGASAGLVHGEMPDLLVVMENGIRYSVDLQQGQKTGMFLDQRENRLLLRRYSAGAQVADCFAYTGGFSLAALAGGAESVTTVDASKKALTIARENRQLNGFSDPQDDFIEADVFEFLRESTESFSLIIVDPPKFAKQERDVHRACRGYKDINLLALRRATSGGILFTFSCSQAVDLKLFRQVVFAAAADSHRDVQLLHILSQPPDHPVNMAHIEGEYLKGLVLRVGG